MSQNFQKAKIYKITNDYNDDVYVGSTCNSLVRRYIQHKSDSKNEKYQNRPIYKLINQIGFERFRIQLICDYPCEDKYQLRQKEGEYIKNIGNLNLLQAGRTIKEYREDNKDKIEETTRNYNNKNIETIRERYRKYDEEHKEERKIYKAKYRQENKEKIAEKKNEKINCECGCQISYSNLGRHKKTSKIHLDFEKLLI